MPIIGCGYACNDADVGERNSILQRPMLNFDDGDQENMTIAHDKEMYEEFKNFALHYSAFSNGKPYAIAKALSLPDTVTINVSSFLMDNSNNESYISPELERILL